MKSQDIKVSEFDIMQSNMKDIKLKQNTKALEAFIKKANRKLLELEILQSISDIKNARAKVYPSASAFMSNIRQKLS